MVASFDLFESQNISYLDIYLPSIHVPSSNLSTFQPSLTKKVRAKSYLRKSSSKKQAADTSQDNASESDQVFRCRCLILFQSEVTTLIPWFFKMRESSCFPRKTIYVTAQFSRSSHNNNQNVSLVLLHPLARTMSGRDFLGNDNAKGSKR